MKWRKEPMRFWKKLKFKGLKVNFPKNLRDEIFRLVQLSSSSETCGILIGSVEKKRWEISSQVHDTSKANASPVGITRLTHAVWTQLNAHASKHEGEDYIGEWHSHPMGFNMPSELDSETMFGILHDEKYGNLERVLLLIVTENQNFSFWEYSFHGLKRCNVL